MKNIKKRKMISTFTFITCTILMCGCASIVSKSQYPVTITSEPSSANIVIKDNTGKVYFEGQTPTTITLSTRAGYFKGKSYTATFKKPGYSERTVEIKYGFDGWYIGNVLFGGLIGFLIVDPATGAMWTLPQDVNATLSHKVAVSERGEGIDIVSVDQVPSHVLDQMVQVD